MGDCGNNCKTKCSTQKKCDHKEIIIKKSSLLSKLLQLLGL
jgi:hypothetical protein